MSVPLNAEPVPDHQDKNVPLVPFQDTYLELHVYMTVQKDNTKLKDVPALQMTIVDAAKFVTLIVKLVLILPPTIVSLVTQVSMLNQTPTSIVLATAQKDTMLTITSEHVSNVTTHV